MDAQFPKSQTAKLRAKVQSELQAAVVDCADRGLYQSSKW
jgi:hypothetical protein